MLVLSRKAGEEIVIGDNIRIVVNRISGNRVTIGIHAPIQVRIIRGELEPFSKEGELGPGEADRRETDKVVVLPRMEMHDENGLPDLPRTPR